MKNFVLVFALLLGSFLYGQKSINNYKYVIVPEKFEFLNEINQYQLNALTKFLLEKEGFNTVMAAGKKPNDLQSNNCLGLQADVRNNSGLFKTKLVLELKDCYGNIVFNSKEGESREKDYKAAYHEALRDAFTTLEEVNYSYSEDPVVIQDTKSSKAEMDQTEVVASEDSAEDEIEIVKENEMNRVGQDNLDTEQYFTHDNAVYYLENNDSGYGLFQKEMAEPFAMLIRSEGSSNFIYNSLTKQGMAYFDKNGNLIVEIFDRQSNKTVKTVYKLQS